MHLASGPGKRLSLDAGIEVASSGNVCGSTSVCEFDKENYGKTEKHEERKGPEMFETSVLLGHSGCP